MSINLVQLSPLARWKHAPLFSPELQVAHLFKSTILQRNLRNSPPLLLALIAGLTAFCTYSCMYAFRKPFSAAGFESDPEMLGLKFKSILVIAQVIGYALSKFLGIKFVSEAKPNYRAVMILTLIAYAEASLLLFAVVPPAVRVFCLFLNGVPLGMVWGLVFSYLEGRRVTEIMGLILCASFEFASGMVKDVGKRLMESGVSEYWMPFTTGLCFSLPLLLFVWLLDHVPAPDELDRAERTKREPMLRSDRIQIFKSFAFGLVCLIIIYTMTTAYRDFRDNFMADILRESRGTETEYSFSKITTRVSIGVLFVLMFLVLLKNNFMAFVVNHVVIFVGIALVGISTWAFHQKLVDDQSWLVLTGFGTYMAYIPFNCILFERLIAAFHRVSNASFFIYLADAFGYLGAVSVLLYKDFTAPDLSWIQFFTRFSYGLAFVGCFFTLLSLIYFMAKYNRERPTMAN